MKTMRLAGCARGINADAVRKRLAAHLATQPDEWMPIETAPKDGTRILTLSNSGEQYVVEYDDVFSAPWRVLNDQGFNEPVFTHWQPLPQPPEPTK